MRRAWLTSPGHTATMFCRVWLVGAVGLSALLSTISRFRSPRRVVAAQRRPTTTRPCCTLPALWFTTSWVYHWNRRNQCQLTRLIPRTKGPKISAGITVIWSIQVLRFVAALIVAYFHAALMAFQNTGSFGSLPRPPTLASKMR